MAVLVAAQGEMVDQIAVHIGEAVNDTEAGVIALSKATELQKKAKKKMCFIMLVLIAIVVVAVAVPSTLKGLKIF